MRAGRACVVTAVLCGLVAPAFAAGESSTAPLAVVTVRGESAVSHDDARQQALREAIERVCGVYVRSESRTESFALTVDQVTTKAAGFGHVEVLSQGERDGVYWVMARVTVSEKPILEMLNAQGLLRQWRVAVLVSETHLQRPGTPNPTAETALARTFAEAGYRVVGREFAGPHRPDAVVTQAWSGDADALEKLLGQTQADVLVIGKAFTQRPAQDGMELPEGLVSCRARVDVRMVSRATQEALTAHSAQAGGVDLTEELAGRVALERAADEVGQQLCERLMLLPAGATRQIRVIVSGISGAAQAQRVQDAVSRLPGVRRAERDEFGGGDLYLDVEADSLTAGGLAEGIEKALPALSVTEASKMGIRARWSHD